MNEGGDDMLVCTKRVFLNIVTQILNADTILNANYYLGDQCTPNGTMSTVDTSYTYNESGQLIINSQCSGKAAFVKKYNINYGNDSLDPTCYISQTVQAVSNKSIEELFSQHLLEEDTMSAVHSFLYATGLKGNGLKILIYRREQIIPYIPILCDYLSALFGEDITFLDPMYRPEFAGLKTQYVGNKEKAKETFAFLQKFNLFKLIRDTIWNIENGLAGFENLEQTLGAFTFEQLFEIYHIMFPNNPLPAGRYSQEQLMYIIMSMTREKVTPRRSISNFSVSDIMDGISDEELMSLRDYDSPGLTYTPFLRE